MPRIKNNYHVLRKIYVLSKIIGLYTGFDKTIITPEKPVYLAGLSNNRLSEGVHDDIYVRTTILSDDNINVAIVGLDSIGLMYNYVKQIQEKFLKKDIYVIIGSSHCHSTPDLIGIWGPSEDKSGLDEDYLSLVLNKISESIEKAESKIEKTSIIVGYSKIPEGVARNGRDPGLMDKDISVMLMKSKSSKDTLGFVINFGLHPEVLWSDNKLITADYVFYLLKKLEEELSGIGVFLNGALGGMITPDVKAHTFEEAERVGSTIAESILATMHSDEIKYLSSGSLNVICKNIILPVENKKLINASKKGVIMRSFDREQFVDSQICSLKIGSLIHIITLPGEPLPKVGMKAKNLLKAPYKFLVGLGNDEIGYIIDIEDWTPNKYEESMSLGPRTADILLAQINEIVQLH